MKITVKLQRALNNNNMLVTNDATGEVYAEIELSEQKLDEIFEDKYKVYAEAELKDNEVSLDRVLTEAEYHAKQSYH